MSGRMRPLWPGLHFHWQWPELLFGWKLHSQQFDIVRLNFEIDRVTALFSVEFALLGYCMLVQFNIPETERSRAMKRELTMVNQGLRTSLPLAEIMEHIKEQTGAKEVVVTDEFLRQLEKIEAKGKEEK